MSHSRFKFVSLPPAPTAFVCTPAGGMSVWMVTHLHDSRHQLRDEASVKTDVDIIIWDGYRAGSHHVCGHFRLETQTQTGGNEKTRNAAGFGHCFHVRRTRAGKRLQHEKLDRHQHRDKRRWCGGTGRGCVVMLFWCLLEPVTRLETFQFPWPMGADRIPTLGQWEEVVPQHSPDTSAPLKPLAGSLLLLHTPPLFVASI